jgi:hypothetical protein
LDHKSSNVRRCHSHHALNLHAFWDDSIIKKTLRDDYSESRTAFEFALYSYILQMKNTDEYNQKWLACPDGSRVECTTQWVKVIRICTTICLRQCGWNGHYHWH